MMQSKQTQRETKAQDCPAKPREEANQYGYRDERLYRNSSESDHCYTKARGDLVVIYLAVCLDRKKIDVKLVAQRSIEMSFHSRWEGVRSLVEIYRYPKLSCCPWPTHSYTIKVSTMLHQSLTIYIIL